MKLIKDKVERAFQDFDSDNNVYRLCRDIAEIADYSVRSQSQMGILREAIKEVEDNQEFFPITRLHRDDLRQVGFSEKEAKAVSAGDMEEIADKLKDDYCEQLFWGSLEIIADEIVERD